MPKFNVQVNLERFDLTSFYGDCLKCPECGDDNLHQLAVEVWARKEDEDEGMHVDVSLSSALIDRSMDKNPSPRKNGIEINFMCEQCHLSDKEKSMHVLRIIQHKGNTFIQWVDPDGER